MPASRPPRSFASRQFSLRLSLSFGAVIAMLMVTAVATASVLFTQVQEKEEDRLSGALATILSESVTRVSFSGKYHARLLAEELKSRVPELAYIAVESLDGVVLAHSDPRRNGESVSKEDAALDRRAGSLQAPSVRERPFGGDFVKEIVLPYRPGLNAQAEGVIRIGVNVQQARLEQRRNQHRLLLLMTGLSVAAMGLVYLLSRQFGRTVNSLADQLQGLLRHAPMAITTTDAQGRILAQSLVFEHLFGPAAPDSTFREHVLARLSGPQAARLPEIIHEVAEAGSPREEELHLEHLGQACEWHVSSFPIEEDQKGRTSRVCTILRDITDRKRAEDAHRKSAAQLRTLIDTIPDLIWLKDTNGVYLECNRRFERFFGAPEQDIVGKTDYDFVTPNLADFFRLHDRRAMEAGGPTMNEEEVTFADDGHHAFLETIKTPISGPEGTVLGVLGIGRDITERKRAEEERHRLQAQLQQTQKMESLGSLAGGVAHDMNNVLGAILGQASAELPHHPPDSPIRSTFETIVMAAERGGRMVKSLLSFARQSPTEDRELDLNAIILEEVGLLERTTLAKVRLEMDLAPDLRPIRGDSGALVHAIMNLCVNAVDALPPNGVLRLQSRNIGPNQVAVQVEDSGHGMPPEVLERALDPFFTTKPVGRGTGLGLSMVYRTVQAHHGELEITSQPGRGTCVRLVFPACLPVLPTQEPVPALAPEPARSTLEILLVDDDDLLRATLKRMLEVLGHVPYAVASGEEALAQIEAGLHPDGVILDVNMPGLGGAGTLPRLRAMLPEVPVLLATGRTDQAALDLVASHPRVTLLSKPFSLAEVKELLAAIR